MKQKTIDDIVMVYSTGLHSGKYTDMYLSPAGIDNGITFALEEGEPIKYTPENVIDTMLATSVGSGKEKISTIEHLMSACHALGITNLQVNLFGGSEIPILDGSAYRFVKLLESAGIKEQDKEVTYKNVTKEFKYQMGDDSYIHVLPDYPEYFTLSYRLSPDPLGKYRHVNGFVLDDFCNIYEAKTYGKLEDFEYLREKGFIKGGSLKNAVVYSDEKVLNPEMMNGENNFIHHKMIDFIGDIYSLGPVTGYFIACNTNHTLNNKFCRAFLKSDCFEEIEGD